MSESEVRKCYRFVTDDLGSEHGETQWVVGEWRKQEGELSLCGNGFHACLEPYDSLHNIFGSRWFQAEARGEILYDDDKFCATEMRIVREMPVRVIHQWAVDCAYRVLHLYEKKHPDDGRPRAALEAAQAYIDDPSPKNLKKLNAARWAAEAAAWAARAAWAASAAWAAGAARAARAAEAAGAAWAAAGAAGAAEAAWAAGAAWAAAWAAGAAGAARAAEAAEEKWQREHLQQLID